MSNPHILVVGSSNTDMIIKMDRIPRPGETIIGGEFITAAGGKGANQAVGAARAGGRVTFIARVGNDQFGEQAIAGFARDGINVDYIVRDPVSPSGVALIFVGKNGENSIAVASGANGNLSSNDVLNAQGAFAGASALIMQLETPLETLQTAAELAVQAGVRVILNPAPARPLPDSLLLRVSILTPNETEAERLTGIKTTNLETAAQAAEVLLKRGVQTVILTLGSQGAWLATKEIKQLVPAFKVKAVDTTAAGDIFNGALAVALVEGRSLVEAVRFANAAAALSVTKKGAQPSAPKRKDIEALLFGFSNQKTKI
jgi:ribokinase